MILVSIPMQLSRGVACFVLHWLPVQFKQHRVIHVRTGSVLKGDKIRSVPLPPLNGVLGSFPYRTCNSAYAPTFPSRRNPTDTREANRTRRGPRLRREEKIIHGQSF